MSDFSKKSRLQKIILDFQAPGHPAMYGPNLTNSGRFRGALCTSVKPWLVKNLLCFAGVYSTELSEDQYSFHHAKIFGVHNQLTLDYWNRNHVYYVDKNWNVIECAADVSRHKILKNSDTQKIAVIILKFGFANRSRKEQSDLGLNLHCLLSLCCALNGR